MRIQRNAKMGRWRADSSESSLVPRTATPTCTIHCISRVSRLLFVYLRTPKLAHLRSGPALSNHILLKLDYIFFKLLDPAFAQAARCRLSPRRPGFSPRPHRACFEVDRVGRGQVSLRSVSLRQCSILTL
jgi:hypothetical protein